MSLSVQVSTAASLDGWRIDDYRGVVSAHIVAGTGIFSDIVAGFSDFFGGRSGSYQKQLAALQAEVLSALRQKAARQGANWVIGLRIDFDEISGKGMQMFMVSALGTAITATRIASSGNTGPTATSISAVDLRSALARKELVALARTGALELTDQNWVSIAEHKVVEAVPMAVWYAKTNYDEYARARALDLCRALPQDGVQHQLHGLLEEREDLALTAATFIQALDLVDLAWVRSHLHDVDLRLRKSALSLLRSEAPLYSAHDVPILEDIVSSLQTAFPDSAAVVEKKGLLSRAASQLWVCGVCKVENRLDFGRCAGCGRDRRGFASGDLTPEDAATRLQLHIDFLRELFERQLPN